MKLPLIEIVQDIMNDIDGDLVNSISDTDESMQVAMIVKSSFYDIISRKDWPHLRKVAPLQSLNNNLFPTYLKLPERLYRLDEFRYDRSRVNEERIRMEQMLYLQPEAFLVVVNGFDNTGENVDLLKTLEGTSLRVRNDRGPTYYTSFDDEHIVLDSYDSLVGDTLRGDLCQTIFYEIPTFEMDDNFIPDLPHADFVGLVEEAKSTASLKVRQVEDPKAEQRARKHSIRSAQRARRASRGNRYPDYGRRGGKIATGSTDSVKRDKWAT